LESTRLIRRTPAGLLHDLLRGLHQQLPSHLQITVTTVVRTSISIR